MESPKKSAAIQYKTKFALHKLPVSRISQYWTMSNPNGLKNRASIMHQVAKFPIRVFLQVVILTFHTELLFLEIRPDPTHGNLQSISWFIYHHLASPPMSGRAQWNPFNRVFASRKQPQIPHWVRAGLKWSHSRHICILEFFSSSLTKTLFIIRLKTVGFGFGDSFSHPQFWEVSFDMMFKLFLWIASR